MLSWLQVFMLTKQACLPVICAPFNNSFLKWNKVWLLLFGMKACRYTSPDGIKAGFTLCNYRADLKITTSYVVRDGPKKKKKTKIKSQTCKHICRLCLIIHWRFSRMELMCRFFTIIFLNPPIGGFWLSFIAVLPRSYNVRDFCCWSEWLPVSLRMYAVTHTQMPILHCYLEQDQLSRAEVWMPFFSLYHKRAADKSLHCVS